MKPHLELSGVVRCTSEGFNTYSIGDGDDLHYALDDADAFSGPVRVELACDGEVNTYEGLLSVTHPEGWSSWTVEELAHVDIGDLDLLDLLEGIVGKEVTLRVWWLEALDKLEKGK